MIVHTRTCVCRLCTQQLVHLEPVGQPVNQQGEILSLERIARAQSLNSPPISPEQGHGHRAHACGTCVALRKQEQDFPSVHACARCA